MAGRLYYQSNCTCAHRLPYPSAALSALCNTLTKTVIVNAFPASPPSWLGLTEPVHILLGWNPWSLSNSVAESGRPCCNDQNARHAPLAFVMHGERYICILQAEPAVSTMHGMSAGFLSIEAANSRTFTKASSRRAFLIIVFAV